MEKTRILFICTANAARSQMAEGLLRAKYGGRYEVSSAGTRQSKVSTRAIAVMQEIGIAPVKGEHPGDPRDAGDRDRHLAPPFKNPRGVQW